jgi:hypothetical protein
MYSVLSLLTKVTDSGVGHTGGSSVASNEMCHKWGEESLSAWLDRLHWIDWLSD